MSLDTPDPAQINLPGQPIPPPMFGQQPGQKKPKGKSMQPTFLGSGSVPQATQLGQKTLLGQ